MSTISYFEKFIYRASTNHHKSEVLSDESLFFVNPELINIKKENEKIKQTRYKYLLRNNFRTIPFGLFAGIGIGEVDLETKIIIDESKKTITTYSSEYIIELVEYIVKQEYINPYLTYSINNSIYELNDRFRYIESKIYEEKYKFELVSIRSFETLKKIINHLRFKSSTLYELEGFIDNSYSLEEKQVFLKNLISNNIIINQLNPSIVGDLPLIQIIKRLDEILKIAKKQHKKQIEDLISNLVYIKKQFEVIDSRVSLNSIGYYNKITELSTKIFPYKNSKPIIKVDLFFKSKIATLEKRKADYIVKSLPKLLKITKKHTNSNLIEFKNNFLKRWGEREIPLLFAIDADLGIGYPVSTEYQSNFLNNHFFLNQHNYDRQVNIDPIDAFWEHKIKKAIFLNDNIININENEIESLNDDSSKNMPSTFPLFFSILNDGQSIYLKGIGVNSGANVLGRFGYNAEIKNLINEIILFEETKNKDKIFAEICFNSDIHISNVLQRPSYQKYIISCITNSDEENKIDLQDLLISIKNGEIILRSKKLDKIIIPKNTNAHNHSISDLSVYCFLCDLQSQNNYNSFSFNLDTYFKYYKSLPRITFNNNIILQPRRWKLDIDDFKNINLKTLDSYKIIIEQLNKFNISEIFALVNGDQELIIDTSKKESLELFMSELTKKKEVLIQEYLLNPMPSTIKDSSGNLYSSELILFCKNDEIISNDNRYEKINEFSEFNFVPGSEWLSLRIYTGSNFIEKILLSFDQKIFKKNFLKKWFFIRYRDEDFHLRIRFNIDKRDFKKLLTVINEVLVPFTKNEVIWKYEFDIYQREYIRYGYQNIIIAEKLFYFDSVLHKNIILNKYVDREDNWILMLVIIDKYLDSAGMNIHEKLQYVNETILQINQKVKTKPLNLIYSKNYSKIDYFFNSKNELKNIFCEFHLKIKDELINIQKDNNFKNFLSSCIHMSINRHFDSLSKENDYLVYYFLFKYYNQTIRRYNL